jgi:predicted Zn-dependent protease
MQKKRLTVAFLMCYLVACDSPETLVNRGKQAIEHKDYEAAIEALEIARERSSNNSEIRLLMADAYRLAGHWEDAKREYIQALNERPSDHQIRLKLAKIVLDMNDRDSALSHVDRVLEAEPNHQDALFIKATVLTTSDSSKAISILTDLLKNDPTNELAILALSKAYQQSGLLDKAITTLETGLKNSPEFEAFKEGLADLYLASHRAFDAKKILLTLIGRKYDEISYYKKLARLQMKQNKPDQAEKTYKMAVEAMPDNIFAKLNYVDFLVDNRSVEKGMTELKSFLDSTPEAHILGLRLAELRIQQNKPEEAISLLNHIIDSDELNFDGVSARLMLSNYWLKSDDTDKYQKAEALLKPLLSAYPNNLSVLELMGEIRVMEKRMPDAETLFEKASSINPNDVQLLKKLAQVQMQNGEQDKAKTSLSKAKALAPDDKTVAGN